MIILGLETSCDETSASIVKGDQETNGVKILSNVVTSSLSLHSKTGGIIPEIAARQQIKFIIPVIKKALKLSNVAQKSIDAIAVTIGPGLIGSLLVGVETAKTLSYVWEKPIIPVNHLIGHIYANFVSGNPKSDPSASLRAEIRNPKLNARRYTLDPEIEFPAIVLIASGGHTDLLLMNDHNRLKWLGGTRDDAAGEAFDKIGRLLGLTYPGGPAIEKVSEHAPQCDGAGFTFPRPMIDSGDFDFSFSGLKTAVLRKIKAIEQPVLNKIEGLNNETIANISASVQQAIVDVLVAKTLKAAEKYKVKSILLSGGVAANQKLRDEFKLKIENLKLKITLSVPPKNLCTDNGVMIAAAAYFNYKPKPWKQIVADPELYFD